MRTRAKILIIVMPDAVPTMSSKHGCPTRKLQNLPKALFAKA